MTQKEIIAKVHDKIHDEMTGRVPLTEIVHRIADVIVQAGETSLPAVLARLEPASIAYAHAYPDDISDGPWDI